MNAAAPFVKGDSKQRFIKLIEAYKGLFGKDFPDAHNAMADNQAQRKVFYRLKELGELPEAQPILKAEEAAA